MRDRLPELLVLPTRVPRGRIAPTLLALVLVVVLASFHVADRALRRAGVERTQLRERAAVGVIGDELAMRVDALRAFYDSLASGGNDGFAPEVVSAEPVRQGMLEPASPFAVVVIERAADRPLVFARSTSLTPAESERLVRATRREGAESTPPHPSIRLAPAFPGQPRLLVVELGSPAWKGEEILIRGLSPVDSVWAPLSVRLRELGVVGMRLRVNRDTLHFGTGALAVRERSVMPAGLALDVGLAIQPEDRIDDARVALWCMGAGAVVALILGLMLDRRRVQRMADRSAELEHLSAELLRANRAKSEFLANVSHELRTPLNAIVGFVDLLRDGVYGELAPRQVGPVSRIEASATHLRYMVDQILDLAKMAAGRLEVHAELVDLRPFVLEVVGEIEPLLSEKGLTLSIAVGATLPKVRIDPAHLRQILVNLLGNAVKFTHEGGVSVRARIATRREIATEGRSDQIRRHDGPWVALQVIDSGIGIPRREWARIFDEFEQVNAGPRGDSMRRGTGLGLSISRRLARLMDGEITVESEEGKGSAFTIWLPAEPRAVTTPARTVGVG